MNTQREKQQSRGSAFSHHTSPARESQSTGEGAGEPTRRDGLQELFASYKVTALQDVTIRACVDDKPEWVNLHAGEVRHGVKTVLGVHPNDAPEHRAIHAFVVTDTRGLPLPSEFYRVLRVEEEERVAA